MGHDDDITPWQLMSLADVIVQWDRHTDTHSVLLCNVSTSILRIHVHHLLLLCASVWDYPTQGEDTGLIVWSMIRGLTFGQNWDSLSFGQTKEPRFLGSVWALQAKGGQGWDLERILTLSFLMVWPNAVPFLKHQKQWTALSNHTNDLPQPTMNGMDRLHMQQLEEMAVRPSLTFALSLSILWIHIHHLLLLCASEWDYPTQGEEDTGLIIQSMKRGLTFGQYWDSLSFGQTKEPG
jgi:hypothetical protein